MPWSLGSFEGLGINGVSAHLDDDIGLESYPYFLYSSSFGRGGLAVDGVRADLSLSEQTVINGHSDLTIVTLSDGTKRAYYVDRGNVAGGEIYGAEISRDGVTLSNPFKTNIANIGSKGAWGVPDSVVLPDGRVRIYWVDSYPETRAGEVIRSATSTDASGTNFVIDDGQRVVGGYVDFEVLRAETNDWIAIMSSTPATIPDKRQGIFMATSKDGLIWDVDHNDIAPSDSLSYLDPTGVELFSADGDRNQWRIVLSSSPSVRGDREYTLMAAILSYDSSEINDSERSVYRLFSRSSGRYLFSSNQEEIDIITGMDWINEGIAYKSLASDQETSALHRFNTNGNGHFYTANEYEKEILESTTSWGYEGIAFQVHSHEQANSVTGAIPVVRYLNSASGVHLYSTSSVEQDILNESPEWLYEGIAWYGTSI